MRPCFLFPHQGRGGVAVSQQKDGFNTRIFYCRCHAPCRCRLLNPPFLFGLAKEKRAVHGPKRKTPLGACRYPKAPGRSAAVLVHGRLSLLLFPLPLPWQLNHPGIRAKPGGGAKSVQPLMDMHHAFCCSQIDRSFAANLHQALFSCTGLGTFFLGKTKKNVGRIVPFAVTRRNSLSTFGTTKEKWGGAFAPRAAGFR